MMWRHGGWEPSRDTCCSRESLSRKSGRRHWRPELHNEELTALDERSKNVWNLTSGTDSSIQTRLEAAVIVDVNSIFFFLSVGLAEDIWRFESLDLFCFGTFAPPKQSEGESLWSAKKARR